MLHGLRLNKGNLKRSVGLMTLARVISVESGHGLENELEMRKWR